MEAVVATFNQEKAFSVITNLRMELFGALVSIVLLLTEQLVAGGHQEV